MSTKFEPEVEDAINRIVGIVDRAGPVAQREVARLMNVDSVLFQLAWSAAKSRLRKVGAGRGSKWAVTTA